MGQQTASLLDPVLYAGAGASGRLEVCAGADEDQNKDPLCYSAPAKMLTGSCVQQPLKAEQ